ncbi:MAG: tRNA glutamyl-Q(34) synthetase GluQRS [Verrucomicrobiota bacterium]
MRSAGYRGRLAPSPTGYLHLGHARTFWIAAERARARGGTLVLRSEDLDAVRFKMEFAEAMIEDLRWFGLDWQEGPDVGGPFGPYLQSLRMDHYRAALEKLKAGGFLYPCTCSRKDIQAAIRAPHAADDSEPIYPGTCRPGQGSKLQVESCKLKEPATCNLQPATKFVWRFRVTDGEVVEFEDGHFGRQRFVAGEHFGDFIVWRSDGIPSYQLACVADDAAMGITEVVRGADLLISTARQLLLYRALGLKAPSFYHCPLMTDDTGNRLAKRHDALSLRRLREQGASAEALRREFSS